MAGNYVKFPWSIVDKKTKHEEKTLVISNPKGPDWMKEKFMAYNPYDMQRQFDMQLEKQREYYEKKMLDMERSFQRHYGPQPQRIPWLNGCNPKIGAAAAANPIADVAPAPKSVFDPKTVDKLKNAEPRKVSKKSPDLVHVITAWRAWRVSGEKLQALGQNDIWEPKKILEAKCSTAQGHRAPQKACECGVWGFKSLDNLIAALKAGNYHKQSVIGKVSLWGRVIETENGFRAQFAYPEELWLTSSELEELGYAYDVPIRMVES